MRGIIFILFLVSMNVCLGLECYVCQNQEINQGKCVKTIKTCEQGEDVCLTEIRWGSTPYWQQGALKQFYISKGCSTKDKCQRYRESNMRLCTNIWYEDWKCSECCKGDKCNYYIISGALSNSIGLWTILFSSIAVKFLR
ncbi:PREDICTED: uncharacterized protein LOC108562366 [Nicrophorus vespilloides]|uniref:Uncharacterized protein LOC108562366 n=1 Tax=Nicrophorus vespilloides TaxID=110193 RepID=A0ABM1MNK9_NICVS|nr:PREDICTED: uncharacterized protein LOC108562366 [Nicrophorus vespilloides]